MKKILEETKNGTVVKGYDLGKNKVQLKFYKGNKLLAKPIYSNVDATKVRILDN